MVKCTRVCIIFSQAISLVVIPHVSGHPSMLQPSSMLLNFVISKKFLRSMAFHLECLCLLPLQACYNDILVHCTKMEGLLIFIVYKSSILCDVRTECHIDFFFKGFGGLIPLVPLPPSYLPGARVLACLSSIFFPIFQI
jgi:hypothetical protein